ncbi:MULTISPECIES: hypothetical protein [unclassified Streptomyces]|uniref:hypothetical protein n=1 Tax=unclassified Streptomyces TaxID=2593676 RepID=UPI0029BC4576|nr:hypothetical protein [Streptomyces sp. FL07-04A]MDX3580077.1 hypothetical protein [Streptomyces sp. FL07-04A]
MSSSRAGAAQTTQQGPRTRAARTRAVRNSWTLLCAAAAVVLGPAAATASALEQANRAPLHHAVRVDQAQAYLPADSTRRRSGA